jgi:hypothetical protein
MLPTSHSRDLYCAPHGGTDGVRNLADMPALDVRPFAKQDLDVERSETGWPK